MAKGPCLVINNWQQVQNKNQTMATLFIYTIVFENNGKSSLKHDQLNYPSQSYNIRL